MNSGTLNQGTTERAMPKHNFWGRSAAGDSSRRGVTLICAMVCLSVSAAMLITTTRRSVTARRQGLREHQQRQTEWLLHGGVRRAASRLQDDAGYDGETWSPKGAYPEFTEVSVDIRVMTGPEDGDRRVEVIARLGRFDRIADRTQCSTRFQFPTRSTTGSANSE